MSDGFNVLISSAGRRVGLLESFREALAELRVKGKVFAADCSRTAPAFHAADDSWLVPRCDRPEFGPAVLELVRRHRIRLVVPTIDTEIPVYARLRKEFELENATVAVSSPGCCDICSDKWLTYEWLSVYGFPTVRTARLSDVPAGAPGWRFPAIVKPARGSASIGVVRVDQAAQLASMPRSPQMVLQEMAAGTEYTINVFVGRDSRCLAAVPHRRLEVRSGEVSKGVTFKSPTLMTLGRTIAECLPGAYGALNVQGFLDDSGAFRVIELNARFGGGYPLTHRAGARFSHWLVADVMRRPPQLWFEGWQEDLAMLRFDEAVFLPGRSLHA